jgi:hypothetical protein
MKNTIGTVSVGIGIVGLLATLGIPINTAIGIVLFTTIIIFGLKVTAM